MVESEFQSWVHDWDCNESLVLAFDFNPSAQQATCVLQHAGTLFEQVEKLGAGRVAAQPVKVAFLRLAFHGLTDVEFRVADGENWVRADEVVDLLPVFRPTVVSGIRVRQVAEIYELTCSAASRDIRARFRTFSWQQRIALAQTINGEHVYWDAGTNAAINFFAPFAEI